MAEDSEDKQIMLTDTGQRIESIDIESSKRPYKVIPPEYKQISCHVKKRMRLVYYTPFNKITRQ